MNSLPKAEETDGAPAVEFRNVSLSFDGKAALRDVSFTLRRGRMICVTGASASGKSVLLRLAAGFLKPDGGEIFVDGREIERLSEDDLLAIRGGVMGILFQEESVFTGMNVYDNVAYRLAEHGWSEEDTERAVREALRFVGLESDIDKLPEELSGGMKRRLEIARAFVGWPSVMLFDEPTSGLDPLNEEQVLDLIIRARDLQTISTLFVTKQLHQIPYLATHRAVEVEGRRVEVREAVASEASDLSVLFLHEGEVAFFGTPAEFFANTTPAVTYMTRAQSVSHAAGPYVADPWDRRRRKKRKTTETRVGG
ncbi:MAG TPA: ATP-binding cassette domain-containing protein [Pyrinomonadaceae bacterium]|jgi:phospholipid/cholesterol/gamma-HCH transport system ATP-binding protein|nr:ATP-binding cassette domain-containing protein [Pyrinomonadaceae bacterium]